MFFVVSALKVLQRIFTSIFLFILLIFGFSSGDTGSHRETDPANYGKFAEFIDLPAYFPVSIEEYEVNGYSYSLESYFDVCYEIFLDITVTKEQFETLQPTFRTLTNDPVRAADYAEGYFEVVGNDEYEIFEDDPTLVGWATIDKIVYNPTTYNVVFVQFFAHDTGVYPLSDVAYFNKFGIDQNQYIQSIEKGENNYA